jgi:phospholipid/cholesterol/gamma-HCH transport system substrate-binding protein
MKNTLETRLGLFTALIVIAAVLILETLGGLENLRHGKRVRSLFNTVQELKVGDRVKMAGVEIGRVEKIRLVENKVEVTMKLNADAEVKTDSVATVKFAGLMGQNFVALSFGSSAAQLADNNAVLPVAEQPDLNSIMQRMDNVAAGIEGLTKSFSGDKFDNILMPFTDFFKHNNAPISSAISNINAITVRISEGKGTFGKLVNDDALYNTTLTTVSNLNDTSSDLRAVVADARAGKGTVGKLLTDEKLYNEATGSMTNLNQILEKVNRGQGTIGKVINDPEFYKNAKLTLQKIDKATESLEDQGPITVLGSLFKTVY